jgi:hypothetical protein
MVSREARGLLCTNLELGLGIAGVALGRSPFLAAILCDPVDCDDFTAEERFLTSDLAHRQMQGNSSTCIHLERGPRTKLSRRSNDWPDL